MNEHEEQIFKHFMARYKEHWDRNQYARDNYDTDLECYRGYRDPSQYPLAYNIGFNKVLPIVHTILSRFMDQLYQSGNVVSVKPRKKQDIERAKSVEGVLNFQLENLNCVDMMGGSYMTMFKWFFNALTYGKGIVKCYWRKEERISPRRIAIPIPKFKNGELVGIDAIDHIQQEAQIVYDGPYVEVLHNKLFLPHPEYKDIQKMPQCFIIYQRSLDYIKQMADKGIYKNLTELNVGASDTVSTNERDSQEAFVKSLGIEGAIHWADDETTKYKSPNIDVIEGYGKCILEDTPYEVGSGYQIKGKEEEVIIHIGNYNTILSLQKNPYGVRPLFDVGCYYHPELYWDLGMVTLTRGIQDQYNNLANLRVQNVMMMINPMIKVLQSSDVPPEALVWKPFGIVPVDNMDDVQPLTMPDYHSNLFQEQEAFYNSTIQDIMGMYAYNMGQTPARQERVGTVYSIQSMGEARAKLLLMSMDYLGIRPLLKYMMLLNTFHLPGGFEYRVGDGQQTTFGNVFGEDIHADYDFSARYTSMEPALGKQARAQQLVQMAGLWAQSPWVNQYQFNKVIMELLDIREADYLLKTPEQYAAEVQQNTQMALMAENAKKQMDTQSKLAVSQKDFTEEQQLSAQQFKYDLVLNAIDNETRQDTIGTSS
jgi:hypothetical protein